MSGAFRKYIAKSISAIDNAEIYPWHGWLKRALNERQSIGEIAVYMDNTDFIDLRLNPALIDYVFLFNTIGKQEGINYVKFDRVKTNPIFYTFYKSRINAFGFEPIKTTVSNLPELRIDPSIVSEPNFKKYEVIGKVEEVRIFDELPKVMQEDYSQVDVVLNNYDFNFDEISSIDCLSQFIPKVKKYSLLSEKDLMVINASTVFIDRSIDIEFEKVEVKSVRNAELYYDAPMMSYNNVNLKKVNAFSFSNINLSNEINIEIIENEHSVVNGFNKIRNTSNLIANAESNLKQKNLLKYLEPRTELSKNEIDETLSDLNEFLQEGCNFLFNSETALLPYKYETDKELQVVYALKLLNKIRAARKTLMLVSDEDFTRVCYYDKKLISGSWNYVFAKHAKEMSTHFIDEYSPSMVKDDAFQPGITCMSFNTLKQLITKRVISKTDLMLFDVMIFTDINTEICEDKLFKSIIAKIDLKRTWMLVNNDEAEINSWLVSLFKNSDLKMISRESKTNDEHIPVRNEYNYFFKLDDVLKSQYDQAMEDGTNRIAMVLDSGNLLRFQPNVFQLFHQLQQATNFINDTLESSKAELMIVHVQKVLKSNDRLLIYSQFDNHGLKRIQQILENLQIPSMRFDSSDSSKQTREKLVKGSDQNGKLVYLTNLKPKALQFNFPNVSHIIHYDNWWNPYSRWEIESKLSPKEGSRIFIYNYYYADTFEGKIARKIMEYGSLEIDPIFNTTPEQFYSIINEDYWYQLLDKKLGQINSTISDSRD